MSEESCLNFRVCGNFMLCELQWPVDDPSEISKAVLGTIALPAHDCSEEVQAKFIDLMKVAFSAIAKKVTDKTVVWNREKLS